MRRFRPILGEHDLTEQQWRVLRALADNDESLTVGDLVDRTFLLGPSLSRMLVALTERGLITRSADAGDGRRSKIAISALGQRLVTSIAPHSEMVYDEISEQLGSHDLDRLYELLRRTAELSPST